MRVRRILAAAAAMAALLAGCDFFSPRDAEVPVNTSGVCKTSRRAADSVFIDIRCSLGARANGEPLYEDLLDTDFLLYMDPQDAVSVGPPASWDKQSESRYNQSDNTRVDSVRVEFPSIQAGGTGQDASLADTAHYECSYTIYTSPIASNDSTIYAGTADITFRRPAGIATWSLLRWVDHRVGGFRSFGLYRRS